VTGSRRRRYYEQALKLHRSVDVVSCSYAGLLFETGRLKRCRRSPIPIRSPPFAPVRLCRLSRIGIRARRRRPAARDRIPASPCQRLPTAAALAPRTSPGLPDATAADNRRTIPVTARIERCVGRCASVYKGNQRRVISVEHRIQDCCHLYHIWHHIWRTCAHAGSRHAPQRPLWASREPACAEGGAGHHDMCVTTSTALPVIQ
jgi:hypothetical protein